MQISSVHIQNFRKLKNCKIDFSEQETIFVGANNSGKTTAMEALIKFFKGKTKFKTMDFTLSNWKDLNSIGEEWCKAATLDEIDLSFDKWEEHLPTLDVWLEVKNSEVHYVGHLIPTLDWTGGGLGVRLRYEPNDMNELYKEFHKSYKRAKQLVENNPDPNFKLWPKDMWDFLDKKLNSFFSVKAYLLDPGQKDVLQKLPANSLPLDSDAFSGLIKVDIINAQRGFSDVNTEEGENNPNIKNLSSQLRSYYDKHLNPTIDPSEDDIEALIAIQSAKEAFDKNLNKSFAASIKELEFLNYPGFGNPKINLSTKIHSVDGLNHDTSVQYHLDTSNSKLTLPEKYNGLGYQNLISIIFKLIRYRDEWMQVGKSSKSATSDSLDIEFEPLHLVLIEEPEAHLHAQVQQVFIKEAYKVLRNHENLKESSAFTTQLVISTHSNHIAHEADFTSLRYFKRQESTPGNLFTSTVINLSNTFGTIDDTTRFSIRYLRTTHCDLFFADGVIMVEGPAERMLLPTFISSHPKLGNCYISILEIGGSHAHTLKPLIEALGIICLIITDLDAVDGTSKVKPEKLKSFKSGNTTLKKWIPCHEELDKLVDLSPSDKVDVVNPIRVAYQTPIVRNDGKSDVLVYPYTFEDSLVMENKDFFANLTGVKGLLGEMRDAAKQTDIRFAAQAMYDAITKKNAKKAEFALELFYLDSQGLSTPKYIEEGLVWLEEKLVTRKEGLVSIPVA